MRRGVFRHALDLHAAGHPVVLLGDYVDNGPRPNDAGFVREVFAFCREAGAVPLVGNHDLAYLFPAEERFRRQGYEPASADALAEAYAEAADLLRFAHLVDGRYLLTHAGVSHAYICALEGHYGVAGPAELVRYTNEARPRELFYCSPVDGGSDPFSGPLWLRLPQYHGVYRSAGITQVVGHSSQSTIRMRHNLLMVDVQLPLLLEW